MYFEIQVARKEEREVEMKFQEFYCLMMVLCCMLLTQMAAAQVQEQECMNQLQPCLRYLNGNNSPPDSCCRPLDYIIKSMPECMCAMMSIQGANRAEQAGINVTQAQTLPGRCGQHVDPLGCILGTPDRKNSDSSSVGSSALQSPSLVLSVAAAIILTLKALAML